MKVKAGSAILAVGFFLFLGVFVVLSDDDSSERIEETAALEDRNAALQAKVTQLVDRLESRPLALPCLVCAEREAAPEQEPVAALESAPPPKPPKPTTLAGWLAQAKGGRLPMGFAAWLSADPTRALDAIAALKEVDPKLAKALAKLLRRSGALKQRDVQRALLEMGNSSASESARATALSLLAEAFKQDPLAAGAMSAAEKQSLSDLTRNGPGEVRRRAMSALLQMPDDPLAIEAFRLAWNDRTLPKQARNEAVMGLRFAPQDVALPILLDVLSGDDDLSVRQQAAVSLTYLNPSDSGDEVFARVTPLLAREPDWLAKGFMAVSLMQIDHARASAVIRSLALSERDPWEAQKYQALAEISARESDYQRIMWLGIRAYREIEARRALAEGGPR